MPILLKKKFKNLDMHHADLKNKLDIDYGETTKDDCFTLLSIPCLGSCDCAPVMIIDEDLHKDLTTDKLDKILNLYK